MLLVDSGARLEAPLGVCFIETLGVMNDTRSAIAHP